MPSSVPETWLGVEPRHLATFAAVADAGSFRQAAVRLGYVQSAVSQQIAQLERVLDTRLIERGQGNRDLTLTPAGRVLLSHARRIVDKLRAASADVAFLAGHGPIRVAVEPAAAALVAELAQRLCAGRGDHRLSIVDVPAAAQPELLAVGAVDVGLGAFTEHRSGLRKVPLYTDRWILAVPEGDDAEMAGAERAMPTLIQDRSHPLPPEAGRLGAERVVNCDQLAVALALVRAGVGWAVLPALAVPDHVPGIRLTDLGDRLPPRVVSIVSLEARRLPLEIVGLEAARHPLPTDSRSALLAVA